MAGTVAGKEQEHEEVDEQDACPVDKEGDLEDDRQEEARGAPPEEYEQRMFSHLPSKAWCPWCVVGRGGAPERPTQARRGHQHWRCARSRH